MIKCRTPKTIAHEGVIKDPFLFRQNPRIALAVIPPVFDKTGLLSKYRPGFTSTSSPMFLIPGYVLRRWTQRGREGCLGKHKKPLHEAGV
jgi:hypothetical protein